MNINMDISKVIAKVKKKRQPSILKQLIDEPEKFKLEAYTEGEEVIIKIKKKEA